MNVDLHQTMRHIIDKSLLDAASVHEQQALREHVALCVPCLEYLNASNRVIAGLGGFSFDVDPALQQKVMASLAQRAQQLALSSERRPMGWIYLAALMLTIAGSFIVGHFGGFAVAAFHLQPALLLTGMVAFWIVPSLCFCMLFPILLRLAMGEKGISQ